MFRLIVGAALLLAPGHALAHHAMGGETPETFAQGLLSGLAHPVIGLDHLAFVVAVGLIAVGLPRSRLLPLAFIAAMIGGVGVHLAGIDLPGVELAIAASVVLLGALLALQARLTAAVAAGLFALAGVAHGYAYGESIVGAEQAPLAAYLIGLAAVQYAVAFGIVEASSRLASSSLALAPFRRIAGAALAAIGVVFLSLNTIA